MTKGRDAAPEDSLPVKQRAADGVAGGTGGGENAGDAGGDADVGIAAVGVTVGVGVDSDASLAALSGDKPDADKSDAVRRLFAGSCDFVAGLVNLAQLPDAVRPEIAFAGRSNVGKSSLINALTGRKTLARTSNTPGRTQQLNFFNLGGRLFLVDMPGYGYAKVSKEQKKSWEKLIRTYLRGRPTLRSVFILVDSRHGLKDSDHELMSMLDEAGVSYRVILTKADKANKTERAKLHDGVSAALKKHTAAYPFPHLTSSETREGIDDLRALVWDLTAP